jgi:hypothetical protein
MSPTVRVCLFRACPHAPRRPGGRVTANGVAGSLIVAEACRVPPRRRLRFQARGAAWARWRNSVPFRELV